MTALREYAASRELLLNLTLRELRSKYKKSVLGLDVVAAEPGGDVVIYTIVFSVFLKVEPPRGDPSGLEELRALPALRARPVELRVVGPDGDARLDLVGNANLIKKVYFPRELLVASTIGSLAGHVPASSSACSS